MNESLDYAWRLFAADTNAPKYRGCGCRNQEQYSNQATECRIHKLLSDEI